MLHSSLPARSALLLAHATVLLFSASSCSDSDDGPVSGSNPGDVAPSTSALDRLGELGLVQYRDLVEASGFSDAFAGPDPITVIAPTDEALLALGGWPLGATDFSAPGAADTIVARTLVGGTRIPEDTLRAFGSLATAGGALIVDVDPATDGLLLDAARVTAVDEDSDHATIYVVDVVPAPPAGPLESLTANGFTVFRELLEATGVDAEVQSGTYTLLAPSNSAFAALGQPALDELFDPINVADAAARARFHLVPGSVRATDFAALGSRATQQGALAVVDSTASGATVNGADLTWTNAPTTGGMIQRVARVLDVPPTFDRLILDEGLVAFEGLLFASGVGPEFTGATALTAFVPTDAAFAAVPQATLDDLVDPANIELLRGAMRRHGVVDVLPSGALTAGDTLLDLGGLPLGLEDDGAGGVLVDGSAALVTRDLYVTNGVVHLVDAVLLP